MSKRAFISILIGLGNTFSVIGMTGTDAKKRKNKRLAIKSLAKRVRFHNVKARPIR
jgi:hypothetical protein